MKKRISRIIRASLLVLALAPSVVSAQNVRGFVFGTESGAPIEGVLIRFMSRTLDPIDTTRTDILGRFAFQAAGPERYVVVAEKDGYGAAPEVIEVGPIALAQVGVTIGMTPMGIADVDDNLGDERIAHIRGRVVIADSDDGVEGAEVTDVQTGRQVLTRYDGRFVLGDVRPGPIRIRVEHLAYTSREWAIDAQPGSSYDARIPVEEEAIPLEGIEVSVRSRAVARKLEPVFERMERSLGGMFLTATDFQRRGYGPVAQMLQGLPSVSVTGSGFRYRMRFRRGAQNGRAGCEPEIWLDGVRMVRSGQDVSEFMSMNTIEVEVIELFPSPSSIPPEYSTSSMCAVGLWTKRGG
jgi:carboxypeptidase family protein/TonB-dependent receptor-like protein